jgi:hypothetical protein
LLVAYCVYQLLVPKLAKRRVEIKERERAERNSRLRAMYVLQHFPQVRLFWFFFRPLVSFSF